VNPLSRALLILAATASLSLASQSWMTDWEAAKARSKAEGKPILINLTGTDWCGWCIKLEKEVFSQKEFKTFATENLILMEVDFPKKKELPPALKAQNAALEKEYLIGGYPTVLLLDPDGRILSEDIGELKGGPPAYIDKLKELIAKTKMTRPE
jgi:thiol:disulfide interchange protein